MCINLDKLPADAFSQILIRLDKVTAISMTLVSKAFTNVAVDFFRLNEDELDKLLDSRVRLKCGEDKSVEYLEAIFNKGLHTETYSIIYWINFVGVYPKAIDLLEKNRFPSDNKPISSFFQV